MVDIVDLYTGGALISSVFFTGVKKRGQQDYVTWSVLCASLASLWPVSVPFTLGQLLYGAVHRRRKR